MKLMEALGARVADLPLRPLLFTAVTAVAAGIFCYLQKWGDGEKITADTEHKTPPEAVCDQATDLFLLQTKEVPQDQVSLEEAEEKHQNAVERITQLEAEESALQDQEETLQRTQDMGNPLHERNTECNNLMNEHKQVMETHNLLQATNKEIKEKLQHCEKEREQEQESHRLLQPEYDVIKKSLVHNEELLKVSLAEAAEKHQNAVESIAQLEAKKSDLQDKLDQVQEAHNILQATNKEITERLQHCEELLLEREEMLETHNLLKIKYKEMKETLVHKEMLLKVSLEEAEGKHQNAVERITQLEAEESALQDQVETLQKTVQEMGNLLHERNKECEKLTNEHEQVQESNFLLKIRYKEMEEILAHKEELLKAKTKEITETLQQCEKLLMECECERECHSLLQFENDELKISLEEAEGKHQNAVESIVQLKAEKSTLQDQVETLQKTVQEMGNLLHERNKECDKLMNEREQILESHKLFKIRYKAMEESLANKERLLKERKQVQEAHNILQAKNNKITEKLQHCEQLLIVESLQQTVQEMGNPLHESNKKCSKLTNESKHELETHNTPKIKYKEMEETLANKDELLKVSLMKVKENHQKAEELTTDLTDEMEYLTIGILNINLNC